MYFCGCLNVSEWSCGCVCAYYIRQGSPLSSSRVSSQTGTDRTSSHLVNLNSNVSTDGKQVVSDKSFMKKQEFKYLIQMPSMESVMEMPEC